MPMPRRVAACISNVTGVQGARMSNVTRRAGYGAGMSNACHPGGVHEQCGSEGRWQKIPVQDSQTARRACDAPMGPDGAWRGRLPDSVMLGGPVSLLHASAAAAMTERRLRAMTPSSIRGRACSGVAPGPRWDGAGAPMHGLSAGDRPRSGVRRAKCPRRIGMHVSRYLAISAGACAAGEYWLHYGTAGH